MLIPTVCSDSWPSTSSSVFPGARAGYIKTSFVPQFGAIGPVSLLLAGHSCDEAGQRNSVGFHEMGRGGWLWAHAEGGGWLGARNAEHKAFISQLRQPHAGGLAPETFQQGPEFSVWAVQGLWGRPP